MNHRTYRQLLFLFFLSGATSLAYETVFVKLLGYVFGSTTYAVSTILAAFMGGLAAGSFFFGRYVERGKDGLKLYAWLELGIGLYCALVPVLFLAIEPVYVSLYRSWGVSFSALTVVRFVLSSILVLPPTLLMGGTLPALAKFVVTEAGQIGTRISSLYAVNTYGAAFGVFSVTYFILGSLGIYGTLGLAIVGNLVIFLLVNRLRRVDTVVAEPLVEVAASPEAEPVSDSTWLDRLAVRLGLDAAQAGTEPEVSPKLAARWLYGFAFASGLLSFVYEVTWTHVLAQTIGTSVYAFGTMLTTMLLGIALGSQILGATIRKMKHAEANLALTQILLGAVVLALLPVWDKVPLVFKLMKYVRPSFEMVEAMRFLGCFGVMFLPALLIGMSFPLIIRVRTRQLPKLAEELGMVYFFNTIGCIFGSTVTGFFILPRLGSEMTFRVAAALNILLGVVVVLTLVTGQKQFRLRVEVVGLALVLVGFFVVPKWDLQKLNTGAHLYGAFPSRPLAILYYHEDVLGGVTSVVQDSYTRTLLTNAKFMGNDTGEMPAQKNFALVPLIFTKKQETALVIGLGTGVTASAVAAFPFSEIDIAEIAPGIVEAAHDYFNHINGEVLKDPRVKVHVTDGRNFVLLSPKQYDLITIELSNVWFAGAASLYSKDFYQLCKARLTSGGVLQQWIQIHHIDPVDLLTVINTMHQVFPHSAFFVRGGQGILIGSQEPLAVDFARMEALSQDPKVMQTMANADLIGGDLLTVLSGLYLYEDQLAGFLSRQPVVDVSSDWHPVLEYTTPRGNQLYYSLMTNMYLLETNRYPELPRLTEATPDKITYLKGLMAFQRKEFGQAAFLFQRSQQEGNKAERCAKLIEEAKAQLKAKQ
ncbi:MAG: fused MFS/spermidine synthase [Blastocatellia bacterium]|nr:fused MFS/spermidine synthase [Blastocatellia bacterium]